MRSILTVLAVICILCLVSVQVAEAGHLGAPGYNIWHHPVAFSVSGGIGFGQRDVHVAKIDKIQDELNSSSFLTKVNFAPANFLDIYGIIGAADLQLDDGDFKGVLAPAWGFGLRPAIFPSFWNVDTNFNIALDGQYLTWTTEANDQSATFHEVQGALVLAYVYKRDTPFVVPYGGFKYDYVLVKFEGNSNDLRGDIDYAISVGCDYYVTKEVFFNVDLTIFSETRIFAAVGYQY